EFEDAGSEVRQVLQVRSLLQSVGLWSGRLGVGSLLSTPAVGSLSVHGGRAVHRLCNRARVHRGVPRTGKVASLQIHQPTRRTHSLKTTRDYVHIIDAYNQLGSYRAAAELCGTSDKTVKRAVERQQAGGPWSRRARALRRNTDSVTSVIAQRVKDTGGCITAKRLLLAARAAGYQGSARNFRRAVAAAKADWRRTRRSYRALGAEPRPAPGHRPGRCRPRGPAV